MFRNLKCFKKDNITINAVLPGIVSTGSVLPGNIGATIAEQYVSHFFRASSHLPLLLSQSSSSLSRYLASFPITGHSKHLAESLGSITPISTVVSAFTDILASYPQTTGQLIECSVDKHFILPPPQPANGEASRSAVLVWEPLFEKKHGERSALEGAVS